MACNCQCDLHMQHMVQEQICKSNIGSWNELCAYLMISSVVVKGYVLFHLCFIVHLMTRAGIFVANNQHESC